MRRYTNWGLVTIGAVLAILAMTSAAWVPAIQPYFIDEAEVTTDFECADYLSSAECEVIIALHEDAPDNALALMQLMDPRNDVEVIDDDLAVVADDIRTEIGSSDMPEISDIKRGVFNPPLDAIRRAEGVAKIVSITSLDLQTVRYLIRLEGIGDDMFMVTHAPNIRIYLSSHPDPVDTEEAFGGDTLEVARLKGNRGRQNYILLPDFDQSKYQSLVLFSPELDMIFGVVPFADLAGTP
ncbi:MAG: hypothetical protein H6673_10915 [Anaerolineales bacterium]|nr:hypothetical protein [Anaerolineales bacterium]